PIHQSVKYWPTVEKPSFRRLFCLHQPLKPSRQLLKSPAMSSLSLTSTRKLRVIAAGAAAACALVIHTAIGSAIAQEPPQELGIWYDDTGRGAVKISQCGTYLCGHIHWLKSPL